MHTAFDRTPYTYFVGWSILKLYYYGVRHAKGCHPSEFMVSYKTSSNKVKKLIKNLGMPDIIQIRKIFNSEKDALKWEHKVLKRLNVLNRNDFLNENCGGGYKHNQFIANKIKNTNLQRYGVENPSQNLEVIQKRKFTNIKKYGVEYPTQSEEVKTKAKNTNLQRYGVENPSQSEKIKNKKIDTYMKNFGTHPRKTEEVKTKAKNTNLQRYGVENPFQSSIIKEKIKIKNMEKYGVTHHNKTEEGKQKVSKHIKKYYEKLQPIKCPYCDIFSKNKSNMKRYHFDNCKNK